MPDVTPTGPLSIPFAQTAILLADCLTLRTACGVASVSEMEEKIHFPYYDQGIDGNNWPIPGVIINDDDWGEQFMNRNLDQGGSLQVTFCFEPNPDYEDDPKNQILDFRNKLGEVLKEVLKKSNTPNPTNGFSYLHVTKWEKSSTPLLLDDPKYASKPLMHAAFTFHWV
ncbi:hypothetical protein [Gimesia fumaroli]|uniref:Uncharacterized protein n=1 Tax=Gimesia fumaroli TaxID=2527976 RepID=A0A518ICM0_9PLAN|nr:hypothetical protein [Gimesia fumaroli]QDV50851.1 hypothetical protein Enr17x_28960 [Gimesia fumaroli]